MFENVPLLQVIKEEVLAKISYWNDVELVDIEDTRLPDHEGEIFLRQEMDTGCLRLMSH